MRKAFNFYASYDSVLQDLTDKQFVVFARAILDVQFLRKDIESVAFEDKLLSLLWKANLHSVKKQIEGYCNANKKDYKALFCDVSDASVGAYEGASVQEEGKVKGQEKEEGEVKELTPLRSVPVSLTSSKDNNTHKPREVYNSIKDDERFEDQETMGVALKFIKYRDEMYTTTKDKKYGLKTSRAIISFMRELSEVNNYDKAFQIMEDNEWATFKREWVKGEV